MTKTFISIIAFALFVLGCSRYGTTITGADSAHVGDRNLRKFLLVQLDSIQEVENEDQIKELKPVGYNGNLYFLKFTPIEVYARSVFKIKVEIGHEMEYSEPYETYTKLINKEIYEGFLLRNEKLNLENKEGIKSGKEQLSKGNIKKYRGRLLLLAICPMLDKDTLLFDYYVLPESASIKHLKVIKSN